MVCLSRVVNLFINVPFQCRLHRYVPPLSLDFQSGTKEKLAKISHLDLIKVIIHSPIRPRIIQPRIISKPRRFHTYHPQTPRRYILELRAKDYQVNVYELVPKAVASVLGG
jgi:hypothetical protein